MRINYNPSAANATRNLGRVQMGLGRSVEKLSSGYRINRAADDAAGLVTSENLRSEIRGLKVAERNALDAVSYVQTAEGAAQEVTNILQRMRELAVSAANEATSTAQNEEYLQLSEELDAIDSQTRFAGDTVFVAGTRTFQVGADAGDTLDVTMQDVDSTTLAVTGLDLTTQAGASAAITAIDSALDTVLDFRGDLGASQNRLESRLSNIGVTVENLSASESRIRDVDVAKESAEFTKATILQQAGTAVLAQANQLPQGVLRLLG